MLRTYQDAFEFFDSDNALSNSGMHYDNHIDVINYAYSVAIEQPFPLFAHSNQHRSIDYHTNRYLHTQIVRISVNLLAGRA